MATKYRTLADTKTLAALHIAKSAGKYLAENHTEIAEMYRAGFTQQEIGDLYLEHKYSQGVRAAAVRFGLEEILGKEEQREIARQHWSQAGTTAAPRNYALGIGIASLTKEQLQELGRRSGNASYRNKTGVHAMTKRERSLIGQRTFFLKVGVHDPRIDRSHVGRMGALQKGYALWDRAEKMYLQEIADTLRWKNGFNPGKPQWNRVTAVLNARFGNDRSVGSCKQMYQEMRSRISGGNDF